MILYHDRQQKIKLELTVLFDVQFRLDLASNYQLEDYNKIQNVTGNKKWLSRVFIL